MAAAYRLLWRLNGAEHSKHSAWYMLDAPISGRKKKKGNVDNKGGDPNFLRTGRDMAREKRVQGITWLDPILITPKDHLQKSIDLRKHWHCYALFSHDFEMLLVSLCSVLPLGVTSQTHIWCISAAFTSLKNSNQFFLTVIKEPHLSPAKKGGAPIFIECLPCTKHLLRMYYTAFCDRKSDILVGKEDNK